ncbi:hypothetical protein ACLOJK_023460 [Asimina triloba]
MGKKRIITFEDVKSIWSCNQISDNIELLEPELRETLQDHQNGCICLNKSGFESPSSSASQISSMKRGRGVVLILGVPDWWRERMPDLVETASVELEMSQRVVLEFFHSHSLKWFSSKEIFFRWCQGLTFFGALVAFERGEVDVRRSGEASLSLAGARSPAEGLTVREEGRLRKKRHLKKGMGPVMLQEEEEERLVRREEVDLHAALALSLEEAHYSSLAVSLAEPANSRPAELVHLGPVEFIYSRPVEPVDSMPVEATLRAPCQFLGEGLLSKPSGRQRATTVRGFPTSQHKGYDKASRRPRGIENSCRNMAATPTPVGCGVLGATLGETSSCSADEEIFWCPFDIEARTLKILSDLLPVSTWVAKETAVGLLKDLDIAKFEQQKLLTELDAAKAERDEALDHAKGKLNAEASIRRLSDQGERAWEEASKFSSEVDVGVKEVKLLAKLKESSPQAEPAQLQADSSEGAEGDASSQASGPFSGESRALIISRYLRSDAHRQRVEFECTHYAHGGFVKALLEDAVLYPKLDLSSLYGSS